MSSMLSGLRRRWQSAPHWLYGLATTVASLMLLPLAYLFVRAAEASPQQWGWLLRPDTLQVMGRSLLLAAAVGLASLLIGMVLAWLAVRSDLPGRAIWANLLALPLAVPSYVGAYALLAILGPRGLLQQGMNPLLGLESLPDLSGFPAAFLTLTLYAYPYVYLTVRAGLLKLDPQLELAARGLGDSPWRLFWRVTLPQLRPALASGVLLVALYVLSDFGAVSMLRYSTFTRAIYVQYTASFDRAAAALLSLALVFSTLLLLALETQIGRSVTGGQRRIVRSAAPVALGPWRGLALAFCALILILALGMPLISVSTWLAIGARTGDLFAVDLFSAGWNSLSSSLLAALLGLLAALPVSLLAVRRPSRLAGLIQRASFAGNALPGIVVGLSLVFFGARYLPLLYGTLSMLIFAYMVRFLPQAIGALKAAAMQINPHTEEAARGLGKSSWAAFLDITLPQIRPGLTAAAALIFLSAMKELPTTLLLAPLDFDTLATRIWAATAEAYYGRAALPVLVLLLLSTLSIFFVFEEPES